MDNYIFDKRKMKQYFKKYGLIFGAMFAVILVLNMAMMRAGVSLNLRRVFLVIFGLFFVAGVEWALYMKRTKNQDLHENKKDKKTSTIIVQNSGTTTKPKLKNENENKNQQKTKTESNNKIDNNESDKTKKEADRTEK